MTPRTPNNKPPRKSRNKANNKPNHKPNQGANNPADNPTDTRSTPKSRAAQARLSMTPRQPPAPRAVKPVKCSQTTKYGFPCRGNADKNDEQGRCHNHQRSDEERRILAAQAKAVRKQAKLKPHELMRVVIESNPIAFMQPYLDALGIRIVFVPDVNDPAILHPTAVMDPTSNGSTLFGVSKDGQVVVSKHKDIEAQQRAAERLFDRVYGKPKQTNIIAGAAGSDEPSIVPFDEKRQAEVTAILQAAKKPSHSMPPHSDN